MRDDLRAELVLDTLGMAVAQRGTSAGVVAHSDHGSQYTSLADSTYAKSSGIDLSMGSIGDPWDNALAETSFAGLEKELLRRERFVLVRPPGCGCSGASSASPTPAAAIRASATSAPPTTSNSTRRRPFRPSDRVSSKAGQLQPLSPIPGSSCARPRVICGRLLGDPPRV